MLKTLRIGKTVITVQRVKDKEEAETDLKKYLDSVPVLVAIAFRDTTIKIVDDRIVRDAANFCMEWSDYMQWIKNQQDLQKNLDKIEEMKNPA